MVVNFLTQKIIALLQNICSPGCGLLLKLARSQISSSVTHTSTTLRSAGFYGPSGKRAYIIHSQFAQHSTFLWDLLETVRLLSLTKCLQ